jgi:hypothetical protein
VTGRLRVTIAAAFATLAAAASLHEVFRGYGWVAPVGGGVLVVFAAAEAVRVSRLPDALAPIGSAIATTLYLTALYARTPGRDGLLPTRATFGVLRHIANIGFDQSSSLATPVPTHRGLVLLAVAGVATIAVVVDLVAVTMRRAALAGIPLLAVFAVATTVAQHGAGLLGFAIAAVGYLTLLLADSRERLSRWGRSVVAVNAVVPRTRSVVDEGPVPPPLSVLSRRIGLAAIATAAVVPLLIPGMRGGVPQHSGAHLVGGGSGTGSIEVTLNPIANLQSQLSVNPPTHLLEVSTDDPAPGYLRMTTLEHFDGTTFTPNPLTLAGSTSLTDLPAPTEAGTEHHATVTIRGLDSAWLPVPQQLSSVDVPGEWRYDPETATIFSTGDGTSNISYSTTSVAPVLNASQLNHASTVGPALPADVTDVPATISPSVRSLTLQVTASATSQFDKALAIQAFLTSNEFTYDTSARLSATDPLTDFLLHTRAGYCQQFASAMAIMARLSGIPSRVAVGFTPGTPLPGGDLLVTTHDAHAWPELWFDGVGWVPFEPTPRIDGQVQLPSYAQVPPTTKLPGAGHGGRNGRHGHGGGAKVGPQPHDRNSQLENLGSNGHGPAARVRVAAKPGQSGHVAAIAGLVLLGILFVLSVTPAVMRLVDRRRRWHRAHSPAERADAAWEELRSTAVDVGADWVEARSARVTARCLVADAPMGETGIEALDRLVAAVERAWYAAGPIVVGADTLPDDVTAVCRDLRSGMPWHRRVRVAAWPRSARQALWARIADTTRVLDAIDLAGARLRAGLRHRVQSARAG